MQGDPDTFAQVRMKGVLARAHMRPQHSKLYSSDSFLLAAEHNGAIDSKHFSNGGTTLKEAIIQKILEQREREFVSLAGADPADELRYMQDIMLPDAEEGLVLEDVNVAPDDMMDVLLADGEIMRALPDEDEDEDVDEEDNDRSGEVP